MNLWAYVDDSMMHDLINENDFLGVQNDEPEDYDESGEGFQDVHRGN
jgi:hypothetical protein